MSGTNLDRRTKDTIIKIHDEIYKKFNRTHIDVFLCGGASSYKDVSTRDLVRTELDKKKNIRILYPEDIFIEILNKDKDSNLLSLETFLADNCDVICIICESAGSLVELGAFTNNEKTINKVIAVIEEKRKKDKSFIMLGPIKMIKKNNKNNVVFYSKDKINILNENLNKIFSTNRINKINTLKSSEKRTINSLIGLYYFIPILFFFFGSLNSDTLLEYLTFIFQEKGFNHKDLNVLYKASLRLLYKDKYINSSSINKSIIYKLTEKGYENVNNILANVKISNKRKLLDWIKFGIMNHKYY